jgi:pilus assembly protein Flp/PilA
MKNLMVRFVREEEGQDLVEYALLLALIAVIAVVGVTLLGNNINDFLEGVAAQVGLGG